MLKVVCYCSTQHTFESVSFLLSLILSFTSVFLSLLYLKLTLSSFIHQGRLSQRKEEGDWEKSKSKTVNREMKEGWEKECKGEKLKNRSTD